MPDASDHSVAPWLEHTVAILGGGPLDLYRRIHRGGVLLMLFGVIYVMTGLTPQPHIHLWSPVAGVWGGSLPLPIDLLAERDVRPSDRIRLHDFAPAGPWFLEQVASNDAADVQGVWVGLAAASHEGEADGAAGEMAAVCWAAGKRGAAGARGVLGQALLYGRVVRRGLPDDLRAAMAAAGVLGDVDVERVPIIDVKPHPQPAQLPKFVLTERSKWNRFSLALGLGFGAVGLFLVIGTLTLRPSTNRPTGYAKVRHVLGVLGVVGLAAVAIGLLGQVHGLRPAEVREAGEAGAKGGVLLGGLLVVVGLVWLVYRATWRDGWRVMLQREPVRVCLAGWLVLMMGVGFDGLADARQAYLHDQEAQWRLSLPPRLQWPLQHGIEPPAELPKGRLIYRSLDAPAQDEGTSSRRAARVSKRPAGR